MSRQESAQILALQVLAYLAGQDEVMGAFLARAGTDAAGLRDRAGEPEVLAAVLDFLLEDEPLLLAFCAEAAIRPEKVQAARAELPGGDLPHWT